MDLSLVDDILVHGSPISTELKKRYAEEGAEPVFIDEERLAEMGVTLIRDHFVLEQDNMLRHDAIKVSKALLQAGIRNN